MRPFIRSAAPGSAVRPAKGAGREGELNISLLLKMLDLFILNFVPINSLKAKEGGYSVASKRRKANC